MAREKRETQSNREEIGSSAVGSAADAGVGAAASVPAHLPATATPVEVKPPVTRLPLELVEYITAFLDNQDAKALRQTCKLFKSCIDAAGKYSMANRRAAEVLLLRVANGDEEAVAAILQKRPDLLTMRTLNFYNAHTKTRFVGVSAWEYALWAGDTRYMANRMLDCIPETSKGAEIESIVAQQYEQHNLDGLECIAEDGTHSFQKHFNFTPLLDAYAKFSEAVEADADPVVYERLWLAIGREQERLPVHVRQHYCDPDTAFFPEPSFDAENFQRSLSYYNLLARSEIDWVQYRHCSSSCFNGYDTGNQFSIIRSSIPDHAEGGGAEIAGPGQGRWRQFKDSAAISRLREVRTKVDYATLGERLGVELNHTHDAAGPAGPH